MSLDDFKKEYPQYRSWDDNVLADALYEKFGEKAGVSRDRFMNDIGRNQYIKGTEHEKRKLETPPQTQPRGGSPADAGYGDKESQPIYAMGDEDFTGQEVMHRASDEALRLGEPELERAAYRSEEQQQNLVDSRKRAIILGAPSHTLKPKHIQAAVDRGEVKLARAAVQDYAMQQGPVKTARELLWEKNKPLNATFRNYVVEGFKDIPRSLGYWVEGARDYALQKYLDEGGKKTDPLYQEIKNETRDDAIIALAHNEGYQPRELERVGGIKQVFLDATRAVPGMGAAAAGGLLAGPAGAGIAMGIQIGGQSYEELIKAGVKPRDAFVSSGWNAGMQAPLEAIGLGKVFKAWGASSGFKAFAKKWGEAGVTEAATEYLQEYPDYFTKEITINKSKGMTDMQAVDAAMQKLPEVAKDAAYAGLVGGVMGLGMGGAGAVRTGYEVAAENLRKELDTGISEQDPGKIAELRKKLRAIELAMKRYEAEKAKAEQEQDTGQGVVEEEGPEQQPELELEDALDPRLQNEMEKRELFGDQLEGATGGSRRVGVRTGPKEQQTQVEETPIEQEGGVQPEPETQEDLNLEQEKEAFGDLELEEDYDYGHEMTGLNEDTPPEDFTEDERSAWEQEYDRREIWGIAPEHSESVISINENGTIDLSMRNAVAPGDVKIDIGGYMGNPEWVRKLQALVNKRKKDGTRAWRFGYLLDALERLDIDVDYSVLSPETSPDLYKAMGDRAWGAAMLGKDHRINTRGRHQVLFEGANNAKQKPHINQMNLAHELLHVLVREKMLSMSRSEQIEFDVDMQSQISNWNTDDLIKLEDEYSKRWDEYADKGNKIKAGQVSLAQSMIKNLRTAQEFPITKGWLAEELITYALTNPEAVKMLERIRVNKPTSRIKTAWDTIVNKVSTMLGREGIAKDTALSELNNLMARRMPEVAGPVPQKKKTKPKAKPKSKVKGYKVKHLDKKYKDAVEKLIADYPDIVDGLSAKDVEEAIRVAYKTSAREATPERKVSKEEGALMKKLGPEEYAKRRFFINKKGNKQRWYTASDIRNFNRWMEIAKDDKTADFAMELNTILGQMSFPDRARPKGYETSIINDESIDHPKGWLTPESKKKAKAKKKADAKKEAEKKKLKEAIEKAKAEEKALAQKKKEADKKLKEASKKEPPPKAPEKPEVGPKKKKKGKVAPEKKAPKKANKKAKPPIKLNEAQTKRALKEAREEAEALGDSRELTMTPDDFLKLTTGSDKTAARVRSKTTSKAIEDFDQKQWEDSTAPYLVVDENGKVLAHEGRHRAAMYERMGIKKYPVLVIGKDGTIDVNKLNRLESQKFGTRDRKFVRKTATKKQAGAAKAVKDNSDIAQHLDDTKWLEQAWTKASTAMSKAKETGDKAAYDKAEKRYELIKAALFNNMSKTDIPATQDVKYDDKGMEQDFQTYRKGTSPSGWMSKVVDFLREGKNFFREFKQIPRKKLGQFVKATKELRALRNYRGVASSKAIGKLGKILKDLNKKQYETLERLASMADFYEQHKMNEERVANGEEPVDIPFDWPKDKVEHEMAKLINAVMKDPVLRKAWKTRQETWKELKSEYGDAMEKVGFNVQDRLKRDFYFRHQVMDYLKTKGPSTVGAKKLATPARRSHLRKRRGTKRPINLNYIQAEYEVMAQLLYDIQIAKTIGVVKDNFDISKRLRKEQKEQELDGMDIPEGYRVWRPREGNVMYLADTIPAKLVNDALKKQLKSVNVKMKDISKILTVGRKHAEMVLPEELADTLDKYLDKPNSNAVGRAFKGAQNAWKNWQLVSPFRVIKYNIRNMTGDAEAVFVGGQMGSTLKKMFSKAGEDIIKKLLGKETSQDYKDWVERGGLESNFTSQEMAGLIQSPEFAHLTGRKRVREFAKKVWKMPRTLTDAREHWMRYASYLAFKEKMDKGTFGPNDYAASIREEVDNLQDTKDKAFMLANDLLGAYDRVTEAGDFLRKYLAPFYSFQEVNMSRTAQMLRNATNNDKLAGSIGRKVLGKAAAKSVTTTMAAGRLMLALMFMSTALQVFNNLAYSDEEDALTDDLREQAHFYMGPPGNKTVRYFPRVGILGDLLEWGNLHSTPLKVADFLTGRTQLEDIKKDLKEFEAIDVFNKAGEMTDQFTKKIIGMLGPQYKVPIELKMMQKLFPDPAHPQPIESKVAHVMDQLLPKEVGNWWKGKPFPKTWRSDLAENLVTYKQDLTKMAYNATRARKNEWMRENGYKGRGYHQSEKSIEAYNMALAWRYGDKIAFAKHFAEYIKLSRGQVKNVKTMLDGLEPLAGMTQQQKAEFIAQLNDHEKRGLSLAYKHFVELKSGVQFKGNK